MDPHATCLNVTSLSSETNLVVLQNWSSSAIFTSEWRQLKRDSHSNKDKKQRERESAQTREPATATSSTHVLPLSTREKTTTRNVAMALPAGVFFLCRCLCFRCLPVSVSLWLRPLRMSPLWKTQTLWRLCLLIFHRQPHKHMTSRTCTSNQPARQAVRLCARQPATKCLAINNGTQHAYYYCWSAL